MNLIVIKNRLDKLLKCLPAADRAGGVATFEQFEKMKATGPVRGNFLVVPGIKDEATWVAEFKKWREGLTHES